IQDLPLLCLRDQIVDGQKEVLVAQLGNERELLLDRLANLGRYAVRPTRFQPCFGQLSQVPSRRLSRRNELFGIVVAQARKRKLAAIRNRQCLLKQIGRVDGSQLIVGAQVTLAIREQSMSGLGERTAMSNRSDRVL